MKSANVELGEVCSFRSGFAFKAELFSSEPIGLPLIRIRDVLPGRSNTYYSGPYQSEYVVKKGDILIGMDGEFNRERWKSDPALLNQRVCKPIAKSDILDDGYLYHVLPLILRRIEDETPFVTVKHLSVAKLRGAQIPLPPLEEQRRIAVILDKSDRLASHQARASIIDKEWVGSVFSECFTDSESYIEISIEEALESQLLLLHKDGNHGSSYPRAEDFGADGVPFISAKSIDDSGVILDFLVARLSEEKAQSLRIGWLESGDVLLAHNASVGKTALYEGQYQRALIGTSLTAFRPNPNHLNSHYLLHYLSSPSFQGSLAADMSQTTRNQVPITAQRRLALRIPPLSKQEEFAARAMSAYRLSEKRRLSFRCVDALRKSLFGALLSP
jgi:type I restriction enzyme S subunit